jgi:hypothetical protein
MSSDLDLVTELGKVRVQDSSLLATLDEILKVTRQCTVIVRSASEQTKTIHLDKKE